MAKPQAQEGTGTVLYGSSPPAQSSCGLKHDPFFRVASSQSRDAGAVLSHRTKINTRDSC